MNEALEKIRSAFGEDAMIVGTRTFRRGGVLGVGGHELVEVYVADTRSRVENLRKRTSRLNRKPVPAGIEDRLAQAESRVESHTGELQPGEYEQLSTSLSRIRDEIQTLLAKSDGHGGFTHPFLKECYELLIEREVEPRIADAVAREIANLRLPPGYPDRSSVQTVVRSELGKMFKPSPPIETGDGARCVFLVGPTGVGKTTTIAKLAARAKMHQMRNVALITLDTFRIGAVDQLEKYADMIEISLQVVGEPSELGKAVENAKDSGADLIFIDSAGRSQRDELKMSELSEFLAVVPDAEVHLVVSSTTHPKTISSVAERFEPIGFHKLILTKVDEAFAFGTLVGALIDMGKPVSYITDGQNVPDDIVPADPDRLVDMVLRSQSR